MIALTTGSAARNRVRGFSIDASAAMVIRSSFFVPGPVHRTGVADVWRFSRSSEVWQNRHLTARDRLAMVSRFARQPWLHCVTQRRRGTAWASIRMDAHGHDLGAAKNVVPAGDGLGDQQPRPLDRAVEGA